MMSHSRGLFAAGRILLMLASACLAPGTPARAQNTGAPAGQNTGAPAGEDYKVSENQSAHPGDSHPAGGSSQPTAEPPRLARFNYVSGKVTWRPDENASWSKATENLSLRPGAQIWVTEGGRAEVRFDDGSLLRLGNGAVITLQTLYRDEQGEFTQLKMSSGLVTLRLQQESSIYQVDTPLFTLRAAGPARVRLGVADTEEVGVRLGKATVEGSQGKTTLHAGDYLSLRDADASYSLKSLPAEDSWERWNDERDRALDAKTQLLYIYTRPLYVPASPIYVPATSLWFSFSLPPVPYFRSFHGTRSFHGHRW
jgi:hypothetical protein